MLKVGIGQILDREEKGEDESRGERSPYYTPKLVIKFILQPLILVWSKIHPQSCKTVYITTFLLD
jgi:hypothetical protein